MTQCRTGGSTTGLTLLRNGTGSRSVVMGSLGNGFSLSTCTVVTGISLGTGGGAGGSLGDGAAVPAVGTSTPSTVIAIPPAGLHGIHAAGIGRNRQVRGLVPLIIPVIGGIAAVHTAENHIGVAGRDRTNINIVALRGHRDPCTGACAVIEEIRSKTGAVRCPLAVDLQDQGLGGSSFRLHRACQSEDHTNCADQHQNTQEFDHFPLHNVPPVLLHTIERENSVHFHHSIKIQNDYTKRIDYCLLFSQIKFPNFPVFSASFPISC